MKSGLPKVLHPVCGKPMIGHVVSVAKALGSLKTYVVVGFKHGLVRKVLDNDAKIVIQKKLLGTADAMKSAAAQLKGYHGDLVVLCGDTPLLTKETVKALIDRHQKTKAVCTVLTSILDNPHGYGRIIRDGENRFLAIREDIEATDEEKKIREINTGVYCFNSSLLFAGIDTIGLSQKKNEFFLTDIVELFVGQKKNVVTLTTDDAAETLGINTREDLALAGRIMRKRILRRLMLDGVTIEDPETTLVDDNVIIGQDTIIRAFTVIEGPSRIGRNCVLGPFCHVRPQSVLSDHVCLGNFSEVSRSTLGQGTFMKHFSFLGDAKVGRHVNIGAGVVTANYDGKNKSITKIDDGAFIGSDSILVAPVHVKDKGVTGAGSVIVKNTIVPKGAVYVGVPARQQSRRRDE